jgi:hypothetical protein
MNFLPFLRSPRLNSPALMRTPVEWSRTQREFNRAGKARKKRGLGTAMVLCVSLFDKSLGIGSDQQAVGGDKSQSCRASKLFKLIEQFFRGEFDFSKYFS